LEEDVREVMVASVQTVKLTIQHVRQRGERMPVFGMRMRECPDKSVACQAAADLRVLVNVFVVVKINEAMPHRLTEHDPNERDESDTDSN